MTMTMTMTGVAYILAQLVDVGAIRVLVLYAKLYRGIRTRYFCESLNRAKLKPINLALEIHADFLQTLSLSGFSPQLLRSDQ